MVKTRWFSTPEYFFEYTSSGALRWPEDDCNAVKRILEDHNVEFGERAVHQNLEFQAELMKLLPLVSYPRLFIMGRDIGYLADVEKLHKTKLSRLRCPPNGEGNMVLYTVHLDGQ